MDYDVIVIGAGNGGIHAAKLLAKQGKRVAIIEKHLIGGTCLNTGCIPVKVLNENHISDRASALEEMEDVVLRLREGTTLLLNSYGVEIIEGAVTDIFPVRIQLSDGKTNFALTAEDIIIATGSRSRIPRQLRNVKNILTSESIWTHFPKNQRVAIIGGGVSGCEFAFALARTGNVVTVLEQNDDILPAFPASQRAYIKAKMRQTGITLHTGCEILSAGNIAKYTGRSDDEAAEFEIKIKPDSETEHVMRSDVCLVCAGRSGHWSQDQIHVPGIIVDGNGFIKADCYGNTGAEHVFCIGDANGQRLLANYAEYQAECAADQILGKSEQCAADAFMMNERITADAGLSMHISAADILNYIPDCIFADTQIAKIGDCQDQANGRVVSGTAPLYCVGMAMIEHCQDGEITVYRDTETDLLVGAYVTAAHASELIQLLQTYMLYKIPCQDILRQIFAHPTASEAIKVAIEESCKDRDGSVKLLKKRRKRTNA